MRSSLLVSLVVLSACAAKQASYEGLAPAVDQGGPHVVFDLTRKPLPEIPFPNDLATRPDSTSPTGLRVNASLAAPSSLERGVRSLLDTLDGFGTYAPLSVAFDQPLDVLDLYNRQNNADPSDDGVYLIDLTSGETKPLDFNGGHFPYTLSNPGQYFLNDPDADTHNLLFSIKGPKANFLHPGLPHPTMRAEVDDLLTFYERATDTLVLRPVLPLLQRHKYAVVLTTRLHGLDGKAISSPHTGINHASQTAELAALPGKLPAGVALSDVAYAWAFTTQTTTGDLEAIRDGLYGHGPLKILSLQHPVQVGTSAGTGQNTYETLINVLQERGAYDPATPSANASDYILPISELKKLLDDPDIQKLLLGDDPAAVAALLDTFKYVDYFVTGQFASPSFLNSPNGGPAADQSFVIDYQHGTARTQDEKVTFILAVPKARPEVGHLPPFPVVVAGHGYKSIRIEHILGFSGTFAKFGLATIAIDAYGHGVGLDPLLELFGRQKAAEYGLSAFAETIFTGRARDLDYDGIKDSGGDFWTADTFHTRDVVRQSIVDWMQLVRVLRSFDGVGGMALAGVGAMAGDFNNDGIPDVGGPVVWPADIFDRSGKNKLFAAGSPNNGGDLFVFGISLGGILSGILPAVEPAIVAGAPTSGAGGLADVGIRSVLDQVVQAVFLELFGPMVATCDFSASSGRIDPQTALPVGECNSGAADKQPMLVLVVQDVNTERDLPIAPLTLQPGDRVMVKNLAQTTASVDCSTPGAAKIDGCSVGVADSAGRLRLSVSADWPSLTATRTDRGPGLVEDVKVQVIRPGDALQITVLPASGAPVTIDKFGAHNRFFGVEYKPGDPLVSPARGYGLARNTPEFRRLMGLSQLILEPGDPINYAPHYANDLLASRTRVADNGRVAGPANMLIVGTSGDPGVPVMASFSAARAAGLIELNQPDPVFGLPIDQVLIRSGAVEGVPGTDRFDDPAGGVFAALPGHVVCSGSACSGDVLIDATGYSCDDNGLNCTDGLGAPRLSPPLRQQLMRVTTPDPVACPIAPAAQQATGCWSTGASACATDASGKALPGQSALLIPYLNRTGQHGFRNPQPEKPFDMDQYLANLIGRYFECRGRELHFEKCQTDLASCPWIPGPPP